MAWPVIFISVVYGLKLQTFFHVSNEKETGRLVMTARMPRSAPFVRTDKLVVG